LGYLWQETPEDSIALYRELMTSPAFRQIHQGLWLRPNLTVLNTSQDGWGVENPVNFPTVTGWTDEDRKRIQTVWNDFIQELKNSTNRLFQIEAKASTLNADQLKQMDEEYATALRQAEEAQREAQSQLAAQAEADKRNLEVFEKQKQF